MKKTRNVSDKYFYDPLYGRIQFDPFIHNLILSCPELLRLREIRMSSVNFVLFPGFADSTRFEHSIGTGYLAQLLSKKWRLNKKESWELIIAALFHDVATSSFGHLFEDLIPGFNHEFETSKLIFGEVTEFRKSIYYPIFCGKEPQLKVLIERFNRKAKDSIDIKNIYDYTVGKGKFGNLIKSDIDLDNIDNVFRAAYHIGIEVNKSTPLRLIEGFSRTEDDQTYYLNSKLYLLEEWLNVRKSLYSELLLNISDFNLEAMLKYVIKRAIEIGIISETDYRLTDYDIISTISNYATISKEEEYNFKENVNRLRSGANKELFTLLALFWLSGKDFVKNYIVKSELRKEIETKLRELLGVEIVTNFMLDKRSRSIKSLHFLNKTSLSEKKSLGEESSNLLLGIFFPEKTLVKREGIGGKAILDSNKKQIRLKKADLKKKCIEILRNYVENIVEFDPKRLKREL